MQENYDYIQDSVV
jgi:hypothetical protein